MKPSIQVFYDPTTWSFSYIVFDEPRGHCVVIDPVLDYDAKSGRICTYSADRLIAFIRERELSVEWILETHVHADHLSSADYLKNQLGGKTGIGDQILTVQKTFKKIFNLGDEFIPDGHHFDHIFTDGEAFQAGKLTAKAIAVPGHTPADLAYQFDDAIFAGDTLFMPDVGTARADFPGGSARRLFKSIQRLLAFPATTRLYMCHDYPPASRPAKWESTVIQQRTQNIHIHDGIDEDAFVTMRNQRDATLEMPNLLLPALQVNIRAGKLPPTEANGIAYLKIPINLL